MSTTELHGQLLQDIGRLFRDKSFTDVDIILPDGEHLLAHKCILAVRSSTFEEYFLPNRITKEAIDEKKSISTSEAMNEARNDTPSSNPSDNSPSVISVDSVFLESSEDVDDVENIKTSPNNGSFSDNIQSIHLINMLNISSAHTYITPQSLSTAFKPIISYFYEGTLTWDAIIASPSTFCSFVFLAHFFSLDALTTLTADKVDSILTSSTIVSFLNHFCSFRKTSKWTWYEALAHKCFEYLHDQDGLMEDHFEKFKMETMSLEAVDYSLKSEIKLNGAQRGKRHRIAGQATAEAKVVKFLGKWMSSQKDYVVSGDMFDWIDLSYCGPRSLIEEVKPMGLFSQQKIYDAMEAILTDQISEGEHVRDLKNETRRMSSGLEFFGVTRFKHN